MNSPINETSEQVTKSTLNTQSSILLLGLIASKKLELFSGCAFFINSDGGIETAPLWEIQLDLLPEQDAIQRLLALNYDELMLTDYLKGRDARSRA